MLFFGDILCIINMIRFLFPKNSVNKYVTIENNRYDHGAEDGCFEHVDRIRTV